MIYLIDDKKLRQEKDYKWDKKKFDIYNDFVYPIYSVEQLGKKSKDIFKESSIILYHESFLDETTLNEEAVEKRNKIIEFSNNKNCLIVFFSGSKNTRELRGNIANIPVSTLYNNLQVFVDKYSDNDIRLEYLLFGEKFLIEEELANKLDLTLSETLNQTGIKASESILVFRPAKNNINKRLLNVVEKTLFNKVSDEDLTKSIVEWLNESVYSQIFLPISFGSILSDFNGLRLAVHIRTTSTLNQLVPIFIYSYVDLSYLLDNEYFNILKTKNIFLIDYSKYSFENAIKNNVDVFYENELSAELSKLDLKPPKNYYDNHSIANEWAIYRWAKTLSISDFEIEKIIQKVQNNLYFKYLQTLYPISTSSVISNKEQKISFSGKALKILYVDDEANKGWNEIFNKILYDVNKFDFSYLGDELKNFPQNEIIELVFNKVVGEEIDLKSKNAITDIVLLDFRLHDSDFTETNIKEVTGYKILKLIKDYNPGIQVIIFSATNKIWNLQALQKAGVDGFILKESIGNNFEDSYTSKTINKLISEIEYLSKRIFLKKIWTEMIKLKRIDTTYQIDIDISWKLLYDSITAEKYFNYAYLQLFLIIEKFINRPEVFEKDDKGGNYVKVGDSEVLVFEFKEKDKSNQSIYKSAIKFNNGNYKVERDENFARRLDTNAIVSSLLLFKYGCTTSGEKNWTKIYQVRNGKAAHPETGIVTEDEILMLIQFLSLLFDNKNEDTTNIGKGLPITPIEDKIQELLKLNTKF